MTQHISHAQPRARVLTAVGIAVLFLASFHTVSAHHSFAMFDQNRTITLHGTVKELQWTNPHSYLQLLVPDGSASVEWSVELHSPLDMYRLGWRPTTLKAGDKVTVVVNPLRDGTHGGSIVSAIDAGGRSLATAKPRS